jgi:hypothetical protein
MMTGAAPTLSPVNEQCRDAPFHPYTHNGIVITCWNRATEELYDGGQRKR